MKNSQRRLRSFAPSSILSRLVVAPVFALALAAMSCVDGGVDQAIEGVQTPTGGDSGTTGAGGTTGTGWAGMGGASGGAGDAVLPPNLGVTGGNATGGSTITMRDGGTVTGGSGGTTRDGGTFTGGTGADGSTPGAGAATGGTGNTGGGPIGDCPCNTAPPSQLSGSTAGPFKFQNVEIETGSAYLPDGKGPFAAIAVIGGFTNIGPEMELWGPFYASWGIAAVITWSGPLDTPDLRGQWLLDAIKELKQLNTSQSSPFFGKLSGQYGTSGYSMGGGGTTIASTTDKTLRSSIGLAPWSPVGRGITTPTLHFCGDIDGVAPCSNAQSSYSAIPSTTPKMMITISGCDHLLCWFAPDMSTDAISGGWALAFNKVYLEGDMRWKALLLQKPAANATVQTNIK